MKFCPSRRTHTAKNYLLSLDHNLLPFFPLFLCFSRGNKHTNITIETEKFERKIYFPYL